MHFFHYLVGCSQGKIVDMSSGPNVRLMRNTPKERCSEMESGQAPPLISCASTEKASGLVSINNTKRWEMKDVSMTS